MTAKQSATGTKRILIVEDEKPLSHALEVMFSSEGFGITIAENGEEALECLKEQSFDLILLDIIMPKKDGFEFLQELRKSPAPTVMILSNLGQDEDIEKGKKLGASDYLVKANNTMRKILERVKVMLGE